MSVDFPTAIPPDGLLTRVSASRLERLASDPITADLYLKSAGLRTLQDFSSTSRSDGSGDHVLQYVAQGEGWYRAGSAAGKLEPGDLLWLRPGTPHAYGPCRRGGWVNYWLHVRGTKADAYSDLLGARGGFCVLRLPPASGLQSGFAALVHGLRAAEDEGASLYGSCAGLQQLLALAHQLALGGPEVLGRRRAVEAALCFMRENLDRRVAMREVVAASGLSSPRFYAVFRASTGLAPARYLMQLRLQRACALLAGGELAVGEVAAQVGFNCPFHFSRAFSRALGKSPLVYKRESAGG